MKEYQELLGKIVLALGIVIAGLLIANSLSNGFSNISSTINSVGTLIRDGLLQIGSAA